jgi:hypothetical protein
MQIRIQYFRSMWIRLASDPDPELDPDPGFRSPKIKKIFTAKKFLFF